MAALRSLLSFVLLVLAGASAVTGALAQWVDRAATTSGPVQEMVGPISGDPNVRSAISSSLTELAKDQIPRISAAVPGLTAHLETLIGRAVEATLDDDEIDAAWLSALDSTREGIVEQLRDHADDPSAAGTIWFDLTPFVDTLATKLGSLTNDSRVTVFIQEMDWTKDLRAPLGRLDADQLDQATQGLELSSQWPWFYAAACVLALAGLVVGTRRGRWVCLLVSALLTAGVAASGGWLAGQVPIPTSSSLGGAVASSLLGAASESLTHWLTPLNYVALTGAGVAVVALFVLTVFGRVSAS